MWWYDHDYRDTRRHMRYAAGGGWWATDEKGLPRKFATGPRPTGEEILKQWDALVLAAREKYGEAKL